MIIAGTGHRPDKLGGYGNGALMPVWRLALSWLGEHQPEQVISGMAQGWDTALAIAAHHLGIPLICAVPFEGQEKMWPKEARERYKDILAQAKRVEIVCSSGYAPWKMEARNRWMVDHCDSVLALYNGDPKGGTANCIRYAQSLKKPIVNLWDKFILPPAKPLSEEENSP